MPVPFSNCIARSVSRSVDLNGAALDAIDAGRATQEVSTPDQDFAGPRERDACFAARHHDLALGGKRQPVSVDLGHDARRLRSRGNARTWLKNGQEQRLLTISIDENDGCLASESASIHACYRAGAQAP
jgi:hypothetical protein